MTENSSNIHHSKLKIGFDAKRAFNNKTGLGNYSRFIIKGMLESFPEHQFYLFTPKISDDYRQLFSSYPNANIVMPDGLWAKTFKSYWRSRSITDLCNQLQLNVYHGLSNELPSNINKFKGRKIVTIHDLIFLRYPAYYKKHDRIIYAKKFKQACKHADVVIAASIQTQSDIERFFKVNSDKIIVGYQNCDEIFEQKLNTNDLTHVKHKYQLPDQFILCVGTIEERKDQLTVLKAYHQSGVKASLVFVGRQTNYAKTLHTYILQNELQNRVLFISDASFADFPAFYQLAEMAIYASGFEGFGIPVLEGLRSGTRMLVALTSSLPEVGGDIVEYFEFSNEGQLTELITGRYHSPSEHDLKEHLLLFETKHLINNLFHQYQS